MTSSSKKQLIINADDFGWDEDSCNATIDCMERGSVTSATIMTGRPATDMACEYAVRNADRFSFGLHFNIVDHHHSLEKKCISLLDPGTSRFRSSEKQRIKALTFGLRSVDIQLEFEAQLNYIKDRGVEISHIDSHGHLHKYPQVILALTKLFEKNNIEWIRRPQNLYDRKAKLETKLINLYCNPFFRKGSTVDNFFAISDHNQNWLDYFLSSLPCGVTELAVHPGRIEPWRLIETEPLLGFNFKSLISKYNIELNKYNKNR